jgi:hypothetical protein
MEVCLFKGSDTIVISPAGQAEEMRNTIACESPLSKASLAMLKKLMFIWKTDRGVPWR